MNKSELIKLKKLLKKETERRNRINELLQDELIQEFLSLNKLDIQEIPTHDNWIILEDILKDYEITESNGILVCIGSFITACSICYQETDYHEQEVSFNSEYIEYQRFKDIETNKLYTAYCDSYIETLVDEEKAYYPRMKIIPSEFCHKRYGRYLTSELKEKYTILNPYNSSKNSNGFKEVQKDFFETAIDKGQPKAKQLLLSKYPQMR